MIFKIKMEVVSRKHLPARWQYLFTGASRPLVNPARHCHFSFKDPYFIGSKQYYDPAKKFDGRLIYHSLSYSYIPEVCRGKRLAALFGQKKHFDR